MQLPKIKTFDWCTKYYRNMMAWLNLPQFLMPRWCIRLDIFRIGLVIRSLYIEFLCILTEDLLTTFGYLIVYIFCGGLFGLYSRNAEQLIIPIIWHIITELACKRCQSMALSYPHTTSYTIHTYIHRRIKHDTPKPKHKNKKLKFCIKADRDLYFRL